jgi:ABC-type lipoprotein release transport system permease subunit
VRQVASDHLVEEEGMGAFLAVAGTGFTAVRLHPLRSLVTVGSLVAVLLPYLACLGLSSGIEEQAETSVRLGADLYVTARQFGRPVPIPRSAAADVRQIAGVKDVVPRIVGGLVLGKDNETAVLVGLPREHWPESLQCVEGRLPEGNDRNELVVGTELARRLRLKVGSIIPPFYHNVEGERISRVVGIFKPDAGIWQANLIFTDLKTAEHIFNQKDTATDLLVYCRPGSEEQIAARVRKLPLAASEKFQGLRLHVTPRAEVAALFRAGLGHREGIFNLHFLLALVVGILVVMVTSGFGLPGRRREIGILKAIGWQTDEVLLRSTVESFLLALAGISLSIVLAFVWLKWLNGYGIAAIFLTGVDAAPGFQVPSRLLPVPVLLAALIGFIVVLSGTIYSSWRAAIAAPIEAMR